MRRTWWFRPLASLLTLWFPLIVGEPSLLQPCPTHGSVVIASAGVHASAQPAAGHHRPTIVSRLRPPRGTTSHRNTSTTPARALAAAPGARRSSEASRRQSRPSSSRPIAPPARRSTQIRFPGQARSSPGHTPPDRRAPSAARRSREPLQLDRRVPRPRAVAIPSTSRPTGPVGSVKVASNP